jgi:hypothetical protein
MPQQRELSPGWLRDEIDSALRQVTEKTYIPEELREVFRSTAAAISRSENLKRAGDSE